MSDEIFKTIDGQTYDTWKEVQEKIKNDWVEYLDELQGVANLEYHIPNWQSVKELIANDDEYDVEEEFTYNLNDWLNEIYTALKPIIQDWLNKLLEDKEFDYSDYVKDFWNEN